MKDNFKTHLVHMEDTYMIHLVMRAFVHIRILVDYVTTKLIIEIIIF